MTEKGRDRAMIRRATEGDIPAVGEIYERLLEREAAGLSTTGWLPGVYPVEATARAAWKRGDLFVWEESGGIWAAAIINQLQVDAYAQGDWSCPAPEDKVMVLHTLVVDPARGGRGLGRGFVAFYEDYAREKGCTALRMDTNARNQRARELYKKLGYREAGIVPCTFNGIPGVELVLLEKSCKWVREEGSP